MCSLIIPRESPQALMQAKCFPANQTQFQFNVANCHHTAQPLNVQLGFKLGYSFVVFPCSFGNTCLVVVCTVAYSRGGSQTPVTKIHTGPHMPVLPLCTLVSKVHSLLACTNLLLLPSLQERIQVFTIRLLQPYHPLCFPKQPMPQSQQAISIPPKVLWPHILEHVL